MTPLPDSSTPALKGDPAREQRLAEALRANLKRRKAQARATEPRPVAVEKDGSQ